MMDWLILGKTALIYSVVTIYLGLRPRINSESAILIVIYSCFQDQRQNSSCATIKEISREKEGFKYIMFLWRIFRPILVVDSSFLSPDERPRTPRAASKQHRTFGFKIGNFQAVYFFLLYYTLLCVKFVQKSCSQNHNFEECHF